MDYLNSPEGFGPFTSLLIVVLLAAIVPVILSRFKRVSVPIVVGEILAGIVLGRSGFKLVVADEPILDFLAEFGLVFLMFLSGMEIDFSSLGLSGLGGTRNEKSRWGPVPLSLMSFGITLVISATVGWGLLKMGLVRDPLMMGLILSTTSLGVVVPILKEQGLISGRYGQTLLVAALIADFITMLLITVEVAILSSGLTLDVLLILVLFVAFFFMYRFGVLFFHRIKAVRNTIEQLSSSTAQIKIRIALAMMLVFVVLAETLGAEVILGAFLAGVVISLLITPDDAHVPGQLETIGYGFIIPIFFIKVGIDMNFSALFASTQAMLLVPLLLIAAVGVKLVSSIVFRLRFDRRETLAGGILLASRLSLIIAAVAIGTQLNVISEAVNAATILVAVITVTLAPMIFVRLMPRRERGLEEHLILIAGAGLLGRQLAEQLLAHNEKVLIASRDSGRTQRASRQGFEVIEVLIETQDPVFEPYLQDADTLVVTYTDTDLNYRICEMARTIYGIRHIVAHVSDPNDVPKFRQLGVRTMNTALDRASLLTMLTRSPATYDLMTRTDDNKEIIEIVIENELCIKKRLRELTLPGDVLIFSVRRDGDLVVPHGNTELMRGDGLTLVGSMECIEVARQMFLGPCE
jgi:Kef-type K+ transport system membrane component KefB